MKCLLLLMALFTATASAADISGTWKGAADTPNGPVERTFVFKVDGAKLTGETTSQMLGKSTLMDGKIEGDTVSFNITAHFQDNEIKINYSGKVSGNEIKLHAESADGSFSVDYTVKRIS